MPNNKAPQESLGDLPKKIENSLTKTGHTFVLQLATAAEGAVTVREWLERECSREKNNQGVTKLIIRKSLWDKIRTFYKERVETFACGEGYELLKDTKGSPLYKVGEEDKAREANLLAGKAWDQYRDLIMTGLGTLWSTPGQSIDVKALIDFSVVPENETLAEKGTRLQNLAEQEASQISKRIKQSVTANRAEYLKAKTLENMLKVEQWGEKEKNDPKKNGNPVMVGQFLLLDQIVSSVRKEKELEEIATFVEEVTNRTR